MLASDLVEDIETEQDLPRQYFQFLCGLGHVQHFERCEYLYHQGDRADLVYVLRSGQVKATQADRDGCETIIKMHNAGSLLGLSALRQNSVRDANLIAADRIAVVYFHRQRFLDLVRADGELGILLVRVLLKRQQQLHSRVCEVAGHRVEQRLARALLQLSAEARLHCQGGARPGVSVTHEELAMMVLSRRQYVTAILRSFALDGLIENNRRNIRVIDMDGLTRISGGTRARRIERRPDKRRTATSEM